VETERQQTKKESMARRKANRTPQENEAISDKVDQLLSEGYELDQATAIAFYMFRDGQLIIPTETSIQYRLSKRKRKSMAEQVRLAAEFLGINTPKK
jgi:hypothetical protein